MFYLMNTPSNMNATADNVNDLESFLEQFRNPALITTRAFKTEGDRDEYEAELARNEIAARMVRSDGY
jgi:hypothetical protein